LHFLKQRGRQQLTSTEQSLHMVRQVSTVNYQNLEDTGQQENEQGEQC
jgi:hypothetical protein